jgi:hypothetical protein
MKKNTQPCANCPTEIYQASTGEWFHLKTGNKFCLVGSGSVDFTALAGKAAEPKTKETA